MSTTQFKPGDTVYDHTGNAYRYIGLCSAGHAVEQIYEQDDDEPCFGVPLSLHEVFTSPPLERLAEDLSEIHTMITARTDELDKLYDDIRAAEQQKRAILAHAKANPQLADLYLWLEGKATHLVALDHYSVTLGPINEMLMENGRDRMLRLVSLVVDPKEHNYSVRRAAYSNGSGSCTACRLASSEEHAKEIAREYIATMVGHPNYGTTWIRIALEFGVPVTEQQRERLESEQRKNAEESLKRMRDARDHAEQQFAKAEAEAKALGVQS